MSENASVSTDHLMPFERAAESPADQRKGLLAAVESDLGPDEPIGAEEPTADEGAEPDEVGSEDDEILDEDAEGEELEDEDEEPEPEALYEVKVAGQTEKVTLKEALQGYQREADYRRKTQAVAEERKKAEAEAVQLRNARDQYAAQLESLALALKGQQPKEPDWDKLRQENPTEYAVQRADFQRAQEKLNEVHAEQQRVYQERLQAWEKEQDRFLQAETEKLHEAIPEWKDENVAKAEKAKLVEYLTTTGGWTMDDVATVQDHRLMLALRKAMLYDEGQKKGREKIAGKVKPAGQTLKPGAQARAPLKGRKAAAKRARQQLARTGRADDAAALIATMLD